MGGATIVLDLDIYAAGLSVSLAIAVATWLVSSARPSVCAVDSIWPVFIFAATLTYVLLAPALGERAYLLLFLVTLWAARLTTFLALGNGAATQASGPAQQPPVPPGKGLRVDALYRVFGQQAILAWIISLPLLVATLGGTPLGPIDFIAVGLWLIGFGAETIGDQQLAALRADPARHSGELERGLSRYSRHPSRFGEACVWWSFYMLAVAAGGWWTLISPLLVTFLLLRSPDSSPPGQRLDEHCAARRNARQRGSTFVPGPPDSGPHSRVRLPKSPTIGRS
jgi:steroid 5-alpha reductase family enzyme